MKSIIIAVALAIAVPVYAADMPVKAQPASPAVASGWAGAYVGPTVGYGWTGTTVDLLNTKFSPDQFMPGGVAGYRWGKTLTFGIELNGLYAGHGDTPVKGLTGKLQYLGDVTAQIGIAPSNGLLLYVGAGPALANSKMTLAGVDSTTNNFGWVVRAGADTKLFSDNWTVGVSYAHYALGDSSYFGILNASSKADVVQGRLTYRFGNNH